MLTAKQQKKRNQMMRKHGAAYIPPQQLAAQRAQAAATKQNALLQRAHDLVVPDEVRISVVLAQHPEWHVHLTGARVRVNKQYPPLLNRTIWYSALDKTHSFDNKHRISKANYGSITHMVNASGGNISPLLRAYWFALREQWDGLGSFVVRDHFLDLWENTTEDISLFTDSELEIVQPWHEVAASSM